jgi:hypothetical protein
MALDCSKISVGFTNADCEATAISGTSSRVILISYSDINRGASTVENNIISDLSLKTGAKAYEVDSLPDATIGTDEINAGTYTNSHTHSVQVRIFKKSEAAKKFINGLTNALIIAIVENKDRGEAGDTKYEVYGWESGLSISALTASTEVTDGVAYDVTLSTNDSGRENSLPKSFFKTSEDATDAAIESLLSSATK